MQCIIILAGPASSLFEKSYYELMSTALKPDGLLACQGKHELSYDARKPFCGFPTRSDTNGLTQCTVTEEC